MSSDNSAPMTSPEFSQFRAETFATLQDIQRNVLQQTKDLGELKADVRQLQERTGTMRDAPARVISYLSAAAAALGVWLSYSHR